MKRIIVVGAVLLIVLATLVACGKSEITPDYTKIDGELKNELDKMSDDETISIYLWLNDEYIDKDLKSTFMSENLPGVQDIYGSTYTSTIICETTKERILFLTTFEGVIEISLYVELIPVPG